MERIKIDIVVPSSIISFVVTTKWNTKYIV